MSDEIEALIEQAAEQGDLPVDVKLSLLEQLGEQGYNDFRERAWAIYRRRVAKAKLKRRREFEEEGIDLLPAFNYRLPNNAPHTWLGWEGIPRPQPNAKVTGPLSTANTNDLDGVPRRPLLGAAAAAANKLRRKG